MPDHSVPAHQELPVFGLIPEFIVFSLTLFGQSLQMDSPEYFKSPLLGTGSESGDSTLFPAQEYERKQNRERKGAGTLTLCYRQ